MKKRKEIKKIFFFRSGPAIKYNESKVKHFPPVLLEQETRSKKEKKAEQDVQAVKCVGPQFKIKNL